jgi:integrase
MAKELLQDISIRAAKSKDKDYRLTDGAGLYLLIKTTGAKWWRFDYSIFATRKTLSLGTYPDTGLKSARGKAEDARQKIANGIDPSEIRKESKAATQATKINQDRIKDGLPIIGSFADVAGHWLKSLEHLNKPQTHTKKVSRLNTYAFPLLGNKPIDSIKSADILATLKPLIDKQQLETAHRLHSEISAIFAYAIVHNHTEYDPAQPVAKQIPAQKVKHRAAIIDPKQVGQLLRDIYNYQGTFVVQMALRMSPLLFQRPNEIRQMLWSDIDLATKEWRPFISKTDFHHIVPLSTQAIAILEAVQPLTCNQQYVFPSIRGNGRPMSDGTIITALKAMGYESNVMTAHGFRTTASTLLNEQGWSPDAIERQLAHAPKDRVRAAYNRAQYLDERRKMMQSWADYLDGLKAGAQVIPFRKSV